MPSPALIELITEEGPMTNDEFKALLALGIDITAEYGETTAKEMFMKLLADWRSIRRQRGGSP